jgi:hypothetical protein
MLHLKLIEKQEQAKLKTSKKTKIIKVKTEINERDQKNHKIN